MEFRLYLMKIVLFFILVVGAAGAEAKTLWMLDFDGTIVDDVTAKSVWKTPWVLVKVDNARTAVQPLENLANAPRYIALSFAEYVTFEQSLAKEDAQLGRLTPAKLSKDKAFDKLSALNIERPRSFVPGFYRVVPSTTFQFYKTGINGENYLLENYEAAKKRTRKQRLKKYAFAGVGFELLRNALSSPETVGDVHIFTARDQSQREFFELFDKWRSEGLVNYSKGVNARGDEVTPNVHQLQGVESIAYGKELRTRKISVVENAAISLANNTEPKGIDYSADRRLSSRKVETHTLIVAEDDPKTFKGLADRMAQLSVEYGLRSIKYVLINSAPQEVIDNMMPPYQGLRWIVFDEGFPRPATADEINNYTKKNKKVKLSCNSLLSGGI